MEIRAYSMKFFPLACTICCLVYFGLKMSGCGSNDRNPIEYSSDSTFDDSSSGTSGDIDTDADTDIDAGSEDDLPVDTTGRFTVDKSLSEVIPTVGIITWSVDKSPIRKAFIEFGPTEEYGISAAVDMDETDFRTLLLGMKPISVYHFRIRAVSDEVVYVSDDFTLETGPLAAGLPYQTVEIPNPAALAGGYTISSFFESKTGGGGIGTPFILDKDGDYVWWYRAMTGDIITRAKMSADGKFMLVGTLNVGDRGLGAVIKIGMDGRSEETISLPDRHHDFAVLPNGGIAFFEFEEGGAGKCDRIMEMNESGKKRVVYTLRNDFAHLATDGEWCHSNALHYVPSEDAYYLSVLDQDMIVKVNRTSGRLEWVLGGSESTFEGASWSRQHGHHTLDNGHVLLFNNNTGGGFVFAGGSSPALEFSLDEATLTATEVWRYDGDGSSMTFGDVQRLDNGNTLLTYSNDALIDEVDAERNLVRSISWGSGNSLGYADWRKSLYGPPDRW